MSQRNLINESLAWSKSQFEAELKHLQDLYYNASVEESKHIISDIDYDRLVQIYESKFGPYNVIGAIPREEKKETLPFFMGSLSRKIKTPKDLSLMLKKFPNDRLVIMEKIDGISATKGKHLFATRGNGYEGTNLNRSASYIKFGKLEEKEYERGEIVINKHLFNRKYLGGRYTSARNMIFGSLNGKESYDPEIVRDLNFLAYRFEDGTVRRQSEQLQILKDRGFETPRYISIDRPNSAEELHQYLVELLAQWKEESNYELDGLVIYFDGLYEFPTDEDPKHAFAFKVNIAGEITRVEYVEWNQSKWGLLKPRIKVEPVFIEGATVNWITGYNASFIVTWNIGPGTVVEVIRSGGVIFIANKVLESTKADLPKDIAYHWNENKVEFIVDDPDTPEVMIKKIYSFFKTLKAKFVGEKTIEKLYNGGFTTFDKFFNATVDEIASIQGFASSGATRIVDAIQGSIKNADLAEVASASGAVGPGFGVRKFQHIIQHFPDFLNSELSQDEYVTKLQSIGGFNETAHTFAENIGALTGFLGRYPQITIASGSMGPVVVREENKVNVVNDGNKGILETLSFNSTVIHLQVATQGLVQPIVNIPVQQNNRVAGEKIVFSGFRDSELDKRITQAGGSTSTSISGKTTILLMKDLEEQNSKYIKAKELNTLGKAKIKFVQLEDFLSNYL